MHGPFSKILGARLPPATLDRRPWFQLMSVF